MDILKNFKELLKNKKLDAALYREVLKQRQITKDRFAYQMRTRLAMDEDEIGQLIDIITQSENKCDEIKNKFDPNNHSQEYAQDMEKEMLKVVEKMEEDVKAKMKEIMRKKLEIAKKLFKNGG